MVLIDGSFGEGGGQILRTALTLSLATGTPFRIENIRAARKKSGLLRQHLTAVLAASEIGAAAVEGATLGSSALMFTPNSVRGGEYRFAIPLLQEQFEPAEVELLLHQELAVLARDRDPN